ncbi:OTU domain-containing protein [Streptomyces violaceorubidus]|uniref:OTU domain-containing protein n=1 Tax=Streptomyces violaceorubidus TaxID=284042 RepID=UPI0012FE9C76|nr:OTU domain-containing protein [Streptomyces violaceorubidus]
MLDELTRSGDPRGHGLPGDVQVGMVSDDEAMREGLKKSLAAALAKTPPDMEDISRLARALDTSTSGVSRGAGGDQDTGAVRPLQGGDAVAPAPAHAGHTSPVANDDATVAGDHESNSGDTLVGSRNDDGPKGAPVGAGDGALSMGRAADGTEPRQQDRGRTVPSVQVTSPGASTAGAERHPPLPAARSTAEASDTGVPRPGEAQPGRYGQRSGQVATVSSGGRPGGARLENGPATAAPGQAAHALGSSPVRSSVRSQDEPHDGEASGSARQPRVEPPDGRRTGAPPFSAVADADAPVGGAPTHSGRPVGASSERTQSDAPAAVPAEPSRTAPPTERGSARRPPWLTGERLPRTPAETVAWISHLPDSGQAPGVRVFMARRAEAGIPATSSGNGVAPYAIPADHRASTSDSTQARIHLLNSYYAENPDRVGSRPARSGGAANTGRSALTRQYGNLLTQLAKTGVAPDDTHLLRAFHWFGITMERGPDDRGRERYYVRDDPAYPALRAYYESEPWRHGQLPSLSRHSKVVTDLIERGVAIRRGVRSSLPTLRALLSAGFSWELRGSAPSTVYLALPEAERIKQLDEYVRTVGLVPGEVPPYTAGTERVEGLPARVGDFFHHLQHTGIPADRHQLIGWLDRHGFVLTGPENGLLRLPGPPYTSGAAPHTVDSLLTAALGDWRGDSAEPGRSAAAPTAERPPAPVPRQRPAAVAAEPSAPASAPRTPRPSRAAQSAPPAGPAVEPRTHPTAAPSRPPYMVPEGAPVPDQTRESIAILNAYYSEFPERLGEQAPRLTGPAAQDADRQTERRAGELFAHLRSRGMGPDDEYLIAALQWFGVEITEEQDAQGRRLYHVATVISQETLRAYFDDAGGTPGEMPGTGHQHRNAHVRVNTLINLGLAIRRANLPLFRDMIRWGFAWELRGSDPKRLFLALPESKRLPRLEQYLRTGVLRDGVVPPYTSGPDRVEGLAAEAGDFFQHLRYTGIPSHHHRTVSWLGSHGFALVPDPVSAGMVRLPMDGRLADPGLLSADGLLSHRFGEWRTPRLVPPVEPRTPVAQEASPGALTPAARETPAPRAVASGSAAASEGAGSAQEPVVVPYAVPAGAEVTPSTAERIGVLNAYYTSPLGRYGQQPPRRSDTGALDERQVRAESLLRILRTRGFSLKDHHLIAALRHFGVHVMQGRTSAGTPRAFALAERRREILKRYFDVDGGLPGRIPPISGDQVGVALQLRQLVGAGLALIRSNYRTMLALEDWGFTWELRGSDPERLFLALPEGERIDQLSTYARRYGLAPGVVPPYVAGPGREEDLPARVGDFFRHLQYTGIPEGQTRLAAWLAAEGFPLTPVEVRTDVVMMRLPVPEHALDPLGESVPDAMTRQLGGGPDDPERPWIWQPAPAGETSTPLSPSRQTAEQPTSPAPDLPSGSGLPATGERPEAFADLEGPWDLPLTAVDIHLLRHDEPPLAPAERQEVSGLLDTLFMAAFSAEELTDHLVRVVRTARTVNSLRTESYDAPEVGIVDIGRLMAANPPHTWDAQIAQTFLVTGSDAQNHDPFAAAAQPPLPLTEFQESVPWHEDHTPPASSAHVMTQIDRIAGDRGLLVGEVPGDGDCLFNAFLVTAGLHDRPRDPVRDATALREELARHLERQLLEAGGVWDMLDLRLQVLLDGAEVTPGHRQELLDFIRRPGAWNEDFGDFVLELLSSMYRIRVEVLQYVEARVDQPFSSYSVGHDSWTESISLVQVNRGPGLEHWSPTAPQVSPQRVTAVLTPAPETAPEARGRPTRPLPASHPARWPLPDGAPANERGMLKAAQEFVIAHGGSASDISDDARIALHDGTPLEAPLGQWVQRVGDGYPVHEQTMRLLRELGIFGAPTFHPYTVPDGERISSSTARRIKLLNDFYSAYPHLIGKRPTIGTALQPGVTPLQRQMSNLMVTLGKSGVQRQDTHLAAALRWFAGDILEHTDNNGGGLRIRRLPRSHHLRAAPQTSGISGVMPSRAQGGQRWRDYVRRLIKQGIAVRKSNMPTVYAMTARGFNWELRGSDPSRLFLALPERERLQQLRRYAAEVPLEAGVVPAYSSGPERIEGLHAQVGDFFRNLHFTGIPEEQSALALWLTENGFALSRVELAPGVVRLRLQGPDDTPHPEGESLHHFVARVLRDERPTGYGARPAQTQEPVPFAPLDLGFLDGMTDLDFLNLSGQSHGALDRLGDALDGLGDPNFLLASNDLGDVDFLNGTGDPYVPAEEREDEDLLDLPGPGPDLRQSVFLALTSPTVAPPGENA